MNFQRTRRDSLGLFGAAALNALTGCGRSAAADRTGGSGSGGFEGGAENSGGTDASQIGSGTPMSGGANGSSAANSEAGKSAGASAEGGAGGERGDTVPCKANEETTVGPFPNLGTLNRSDVRGNSRGDTTPKLGAKLTLRVRVLDLDAFCAPLASAVVDIWQCNAAGLYAGYAAFNTAGQDFCRGYQTTNAQGAVEFVTIFPGSYAGRALHIHVSVRGAAGTLTPNAQGQDVPDVFVAQLYFEGSVAAEIFRAVPLYQQGAAITPNASDAFFSGGGNDLIVDVTKNGGDYVGNVAIGVRRSAVGL